ncbi:MAG: DUF547 domain-containing protein [Deinococcota bacterium]
MKHTQRQRIRWILAWFVIIAATSTNLATAQVNGSFGDYPSYDAMEAHMDELFARYVDETGFVNYETWWRDPGDLLILDNLVRALAGVNPADSDTYFASEADALAYWINAYNLFAIHEVLQRYPVDTIRPTRLLIPERSFFTEQRYQIWNDIYSLDELENSILRVDFDEPRFHFAINCASFSCPLLIDEAYKGESLDAQLDAQARAFINDPLRNQFDTATNTAQVSKIFDWFEEDFEDVGGVVSYLAQFAEGDALEVLSSDDLTLRYMTYDWSLNSQ